MKNQHVIEVLEDKVDSYLDNTPWYVALLVPEVRYAKKASKDLAALRQIQHRDESWFEAYAAKTNDLYDSLHSGALSASELYYDLIDIPYVGEFVQNKALGGLEQLLSPITNEIVPEHQEIAHYESRPPTYAEVSIPRVQDVETLIESGRSLRLALLASEASYALDQPMDALHTQYVRAYSPKREPSLIRDAVVGLARALGTLLESVYGPAQQNAYE